MSLVHLLDTNIASCYLRRSSAALEARVNQGLLRQTVALSVLTRAELRFGHVNAGMAQDDRRRSLIDHFLLQLPSLPWTPQAADQYGTLKDAHRRSVTPIGELDTQIAASAGRPARRAGSLAVDIVTLGSPATDPGRYSSRLSLMDGFQVCLPSALTSFTYR